MIDDQAKRTGPWPGTENEVINPVLPEAERLNSSGRLSKARQLGVMARSPVMWFMLVIAVLSLVAFVVVWSIEKRSSPVGPKDPLSSSIRP